MVRSHGRVRATPGIVRAARVVAIFTTLALSVQEAKAEVRLTGPTAGNYRVSVKSWWEIPFRSVVRQQYDFSCGSAAVATLLSYHYARPTPERDVFAGMWQVGDQAVIRKSGFSMLDMKNYLAQVGYRADGYRLSIAELGKLRTPSIVLIDLRGYKHFVVVKGAWDGRILVGDPMRGLGDYSADDFSRLWNGIALVIAQSAGTVRPRFNLAADWGPWSTAPLEQDALRVPTGRLTTFLPPDYQITSEMLLDIRAGTVTR